MNQLGSSVADMKWWWEKRKKLPPWGLIQHRNALMIFLRCFGLFSCVPAFALCLTGLTLKIFKSIRWTCVEQNSLKKLAWRRLGGPIFEKAGKSKVLNEGLGSPRIKQKVWEEFEGLGSPRIARRAGKPKGLKGWEVLGLSKRAPLGSLRISWKFWWWP